jgi:hypothetical protein
MDLLSVEYALLLTRKSDIDLGFASVNILILWSITQHIQQVIIIVYYLIDKDHSKSICHHIWYEA